MDAVNSILAHIIAAINRIANPLGAVFLAPAAVLPGWLYITFISAVMGPLLLLLFKYTSNQDAIGRARNDIRVDMLALKLFKDQLSVIFLAQARLMRSSLRLLFHSLPPLLIGLPPMLLVLSQMGACYQNRPLSPGEEAVLTVEIGGRAGDAFPEAKITSLPGAEVTVGPVRIPSRREIRWLLRSEKPGDHRIVISVDRREVEKRLKTGDGFRRVSPLRPGWRWLDILIHPLEKPFPPGSPVSAVRIDYPERAGWAGGSNWWLFHFFIVSMAFALLFKPVFRVRI